MLRYLGHYLILQFEIAENTLLPVLGFRLLAVAEYNIRFNDFNDSITEVCI